LHTLEKYFPESDTEYIRNKYSRLADDLARIELIKTRLSGRADAITPGQIENLLDALTEEKGWSSASTRNHHHNLFSRLPAGHHAQQGKRKSGAWSPAQAGKQFARAVPDARRREETAQGYPVKCGMGRA
jgi:hypothetical protein